MPARSALRVIEQSNNYQPGLREVPEDAVLASYQILADAMGASLEVTLDGQVVLYTGYYKPSLQRIIDLYDPKKYIEARDLTPEEEEELKNKESK